MEHKEYKKYHEAHMMHNKGTTVEECIILLSTIPFCVFFSLWLSKISKERTVVLEFCMIVLPVILNCTILSNVNHIIFAFLLLFFTTIVIFKVNINVVKQLLNSKIQGKQAFITNYRASTNFVSALCILAVDFTVFPKRFAKTESFGFGLMDLGVGFFICSNGFVEKHGALPSSFKKLLKTTSVLFFLGMVRVLLVKSIDYHEHVLEYGVHWNFYFTLSLCQIISYFVKYFTNYKDPIWLALLIGLVHQSLLSLGLQEWVLSDIPRDSFINANREGLISCLGYVSLYFAASAVGKFITRSKNLTYKKLLLNLLLITVLSLLGTSVCQKTILVSRRLVNLGYILWILALSLTVLLLFIIGELSILGMYSRKVTYTFPPVPILLESINTNGLAFFILANLLTGLINIFFQTLLLGKAISMLLIVSYMVILCGVFYNLFLKKIILKF